MGIPWGKIGGVLKHLLPFVPLVGGPVGVILKAVSQSVIIIEDVALGMSGSTKRQKAIDLVGSLLVVGEEAAGRDLISDPLVVTAVGKVIDCEVSLRNAHAALAAVVEDIQAKRTSE
jgi:hypothetical protein